MLKLSAIKSEKVWGYELWAASTHPNGCQDEFKALCGGDYPLLVKIIQADDKLSIQVHPDDEAAVRFEGAGCRGKTECWYVLDAADDAKLVYGIKDGVGDDVLAKAIEENRLEEYLQIVPVKKGDFIFIPAGTVHAIGAGLRLLEVQQSCDITYRLYDWGRGREVHIEKGLAVTKHEKPGVVAQFPGEFECDYFSLETVDVKGGWSMFCSHGDGKPGVDGANENGDLPKDVQLIYVVSSDRAVIRTSEEKFGKTICAEEIYAVAPGEKITIEGRAKIMKIKAK